ncbi:MAG: sterol desaturase family protein [Aquisalinus sp.]|nr:sterol desaturase family protein [Aquisalinus sp.]
MEQAIDYKPIIIAILFGFVLLELLIGTFHDRAKMKPGDIWIEIVGTLSLFLIITPFAFYVTPVALEAVFPGSANAWSGLPWWGMVIVLLLGDDLTQYWWHRSCHNVPALYNLHRAHHSCNYMGVRLTYRNNIFYFLLIPSLWAGAALVHLGLGAVYAVYIIIKQSIIFGAHSTVKWDQKLYSISWLKPFVWVMQRTISTPTTHFAHHGLHKEDGVTNYKGNYGNLLFFWDVLFGTAKISQTYPPEYGIENIPQKNWQHEMFWPLYTDKNEELSVPAEPASRQTPAE